MNSNYGYIGEGQKRIYELRPYSCKTTHNFHTNAYTKMKDNYSCIIVKPHQNNRLQHTHKRNGNYDHINVKPHIKE